MAYEGTPGEARRVYLIAGLDLETHCIDAIPSAMRRVTANFA